jgi:hypothetical protein
VPPQSCDWAYGDFNFSFSGFGRGKMKAGLFFMALTTCCTMTVAQEVQPIRLVSPSPIDTPIGHKLSAAVDAAFRRIGTPYTMVYNPAERAVLGFKSGIFDGDVSRARTFGETMPDAIRVDPPLLVGEFVAVANAGGTLPKSWADLTPMRFAYLRGSKAIEANTHDAVSAHPVDSHAACLGMVKLQRVDVCVGLAVDVYSNAVYKAEAQQLKAARFAREGSYIWLGPQHRELALKLGAALAEMEKSGELARYFK